MDLGRPQYARGKMKILTAVRKINNAFAFMFSKLQYCLYGIGNALFETNSKTLLGRKFGLI